MPGESLRHTIETDSLPPDSQTFAGAENLRCRALCSPPAGPQQGPASRTRKGCCAIEDAKPEGTAEGTNEFVEGEKGHEENIAQVPQQSLPPQNVGERHLRTPEQLDR